MHDEISDQDIELNRISYELANIINDHIDNTLEYGMGSEMQTTSFFSTKDRIKALLQSIIDGQ